MCGMRKVTEFGKFLRKLRVDREEYQKDMSSKLGVTLSYLSAVELGKRGIPSDWCDKLKVLYDLTESEYTKIYNITIDSKSVLKIDVSNMSIENKCLLTTIAEKMDGMSDETKNCLYSIIGGV